ncbi:amidase [Cytophagaceae bacterium DM2B3-1]|uniref:Amidase n=1 Tax=Xanthocytophaga flava TaxID=3048013 RepID=A0ABT7CPB4_9BACT|nr:amidase [Xanthocytophaga flavus]MDJ1468724.1 amidase [Xanthocytophaga flavus]MDJ1495584.1 amidase [Xanthocytophaga flavus]
MQLKPIYSRWLLLAGIASVSFVSGAFLTRQSSQPITSSMVQQASEIIGLEFTPAERDTMLDDLADQRKGFDNFRKVALSNDIAPALTFNPLPKGFKINTQKKPFKTSPVGAVSLPAHHEDLAFYTVTQLAELIRTRKITSLELTQFFLERLKKYGPKLESVITLTEDLALKQAKQADTEIKAGKYKGLLHGIPYGAKDLLAKKGYRTTWGSVPYQYQVLEMDATVIRKLEEAGAVLVAKLTLGELAWGDVWFGGKTRNPWNLAEGSSGSSAGSGASVSAGLIPFAIGTETLGSIVSPSTVCGITGLRPTFGRVSRHGAMALSWSMDKIGPMCRTVEDCAVVFNAIYGPDGLDHSVIDASFNYTPLSSLKGLKIGYLKTAFESTYPNQPFDHATLQKVKELGAELIPIELPELPYQDATMIISVEGAAAFDELTRSNKDDQMVRQGKNAWPNVFRAARFVPAVEYLQANRIRTLLIEQMNEKLKGLDAYITPTYMGGNLSLTNLTGHPCVVVPNGFNDKGLPVSITFMGKLLDEAKLLAIAKLYQDATPFHQQHPKLAL